MWRVGCGPEDCEDAGSRAGPGPCSASLNNSSPPIHAGHIPPVHSGSGCSPQRCQGSKPSSGRWFGWPHSGWLYRGVAVAFALLLAFHATACGAFFCFRFSRILELPREVVDDIRDIYILAGGPKTPARLQGMSEQQFLIPKLIHQTYKSSNVPAAVVPLMHSWRRNNPDWEVRFYDDDACLRFVQREFPEYLAAYKSLPKDVERSDFFRYMIILRLGGVYADIDTECRKPLSQLIQPRDTMVVSWENEFPTAEEASRRQYVRKRQILQWVFAAAPGHPGLRQMCDHIAASATKRLSDHASFDTLERTGPGMWTDILLRQAILHSPGQSHVDPWGVRILPMVFFGAHPAGYDSVLPDDPNVAALHHFLGSWKDRGLAILRPSALRRLAITGWHHLWPQSSPALLHDDGRRHLYPVSVTFQPPFSLLVDLAGHGDLQAGDDAGALLTKYGTWQPSLHHTRGPPVLDAIVGSLGGVGGERRVLLDVGAGQGLFSLAAAARGHGAIAFELSAMSTSAFQASIAYNGFDDRIHLHEVALGHRQEDICVSSALVEDAGRGSPFSRGYAHPQLHAASASCTSKAQRHLGDAFVPRDVEVGAVHIAAPGWEGWIVDGLRDVLMRKTPPGAILLELYPGDLEAHGYPGGAAALLQQLHDLGYTDMSHSGHVCDERWDNVTRSIKLQAAVGLPRPETLKQPTWCHLKPHRIASIVQRVPRDRPENVLLLFMGTHAAEHPQEASGQLLSQQMTEVYRGHIVLSTGEKIGVSTGGMLEYEQHMAVLEAAAEAGDKPAGSHESAPALDAQSSHAQPAEAPRPRRKGEAPSGARPAVEDSKSSEERVLSKGRRSAPGAHKATKGVDSQHRARRR